MPLQSITVRVKDSVKIMDYADPRTYDLTGVVVLGEGDDADAELGKAIATLTARGNAFLRGQNAQPADAKPRTGKPQAAPPAAETKPASAPPPAEVVGPASDAGTETGAGSAPTEPATSAEIDNDAVVHAVMQANERLKDPAKLRKLVETYNPSPGLRVFKATEIEQKDRAGFLDKLKMLGTADESKALPEELPI